MLNSSFFPILMQEQPVPAASQQRITWAPHVEWVLLTSAPASVGCSVHTQRACSQVREKAMEEVGEGML